MESKKTIRFNFRKQNRDIFEAVKDGRKPLETRAASPKFQRIKVGDTAKMVCGKESFEEEITSVEFFRTIEDLLKKYHFKKINPFAFSKEDLYKMWQRFSGYLEKIKKYGLVALKFKGIT